MVNYPYTVKVGSLRKFLEKIPVIGIPDKVTNKLIYALNLKSTNDRQVIPILKFIKFLDPSGTPTDYYKQYRDKSKSTGILGEAVKEAYSDVFQVYPDANKQESETLKNFFSTNTGLGEKATKAVVDTFRTLCSMASFEGIKKEEENNNVNKEDKNPEEGEVKIIIKGNGMKKEYIARSSEEVQKIYEGELKKAITAINLLFPEEK